MHFVLWRIITHDSASVFWRRGGPITPSSGVICSRTSSRVWQGCVALEKSENAALDERPDILRKAVTTVCHKIQVNPRI